MNECLLLCVGRKHQKQFQTSQQNSHLTKYFQKSLLCPPSSVDGSWLMMTDPLELTVGRVLVELGDQS